MNIQNEQKCVNMALESAYAKGKKNTIDKACIYLKKLTEYHRGLGSDIRVFEDSDIEEFRKAMEE